MNFRGASGAADFRYKDKHAALLKKISAPEFGTAVAMSKVKLPPVEKWLARRITELLGGVEDDIAIGMACNHLACETPDPKELVAQLDGVLGSAIALDLVAELWRLLISAQASATGLPAEWGLEGARAAAAAAAQRFIAANVRVIPLPPTLPAVSPAPVAGEGRQLGGAPAGEGSRRASDRDAGRGEERRFRDRSRSRDRRRRDHDDGGREGRPRLRSRSRERHSSRRDESGRDRRRSRSRDRRRSRDRSEDSRDGGRRRRRVQTWEARDSRDGGGYGRALSHERRPVPVEDKDAFGRDRTLAARRSDREGGKPTEREEGGAT